MTASRSMTDIMAIRRDLIAFRAANKGNALLTHRASDMICQLEQLQRPNDPAHDQRLRIGIARIVREFEHIKQTGAPPEPRADGGRA